jgi:heat shock protein HslJ
MKWLITLLTAMLALGAAHAAQPLSGTHWRLERIESMEDAQPPLVPPQQHPIELHFGLDGQATFRLDCNRGMAHFSASVSAGGEASGGLQFGGLASTRAACVSGSLEPTVIKQLPYVRSWLLRNGRLHLSLMADGGILTFAPLRP